MGRGIVLAITLALFTVPASAEFATYYGGSDGYCGKKTANGERFNCGAMTVAHRKLPFGTNVHLCGPAGCATVRVNDRGPYANGATWDLSMAAARIICGGLRSCHVHQGAPTVLRKGDWGL